MALITDARFIGHYNDDVDAVVLQADPDTFALKTKDGQMITNPLLLLPYYNPNANSMYGGVGMFYYPKLGDIFNVEFDKFGAPHVMGAVMNQYPNLVWKQFNPGDIIFVGAQGNRLRFADAGFIELFSTPLNAIRLYQTNDRMEILAQRMDMTTDEFELIADKDITGTKIALTIKDQPTGFPTGNILNFDIKDSTGSSVISFTSSKDGTYTVKTKKSVVVNAPNVVLGAASSSDPALLGNETNTVFTDILQTLNDILTALTGQIIAPAGTAGGPCTAPLAQPILQKDIQTMQTDLQKILSRIVMLK